ncbi:MAG: hypothetical protein JWO15_3679 [Sphingomonadales bacterium]|nr:hypothetical protein [Sphingomonadales bacterium]
MAKVRNQLQIVIDQLSLDKSTGSYLNTISGNYGLDRPFLGFSDAQWRAATKLLALQYKQIANKFRDILALMLGPQHTLTANLSVSIPAGSYKVPVFSTVGLPQTGNLTLDAGLSTEETINYKFVDNASSVIILTEPTQFAHIAVNHDAESILVSCNVGSVHATVVNSEAFPQDFSGGKRYSLTLGRGTAQEEVVQLLGNTVSTGILNISPAQFNHVLPNPLPGVANTTRAYSTASFTLYIDNLGLLPESGVIRLGTTPPKLVQYTSRSTTDGTINLKYTIPVAVPAGTLVEVIPATSVATLGEVRFPGIGWDVIQSTPRNVEILIPRSESTQDLRTASYLHAPFSTHFTSLDNNESVGATNIPTATPSLWPQAGTIVIHSGFSIGFDAEYVGYNLAADGESLDVPFGLKSAHSSGDHVEFYSPTYSELGHGEIESGDIYGTKLFPFPGPYVYSPDQLAAKSTVVTTLAKPLSAPTALLIDTQPSAGAAVLEVEDGSFFPPPGTGFTLTLGDETITATKVHYHSSTALSIVSASGTSIVVASGQITTNGFPLVGGFRMILSSPNDAPAKDEIVFITAVNAGTNTLTTESAIQTARSGGGLGAYATAIGDLVSVTQIDEFHKGLTPYASRAPIRTTRFPLNELPRNTADVEIASVVYTSVSLTSGAGFPTTGGDFIASFGVVNREDFSYSSRSGNTLHMDTAFTPTKSHAAGDPINFSAGSSVPVDTGFDFPLRVPVAEFDNIRFLIDLIRAAGVEINFIYKR